jgi:hypothetical protein
MGIMKTLHTARHARRIRQQGKGGPMATATPVKSPKKPAPKTSAAKAAPTHTVKPPVAPSPAAPVQPARVGLHRNTVENGTPKPQEATMSVAARKRRYKPGWKALIVVRDGTRHYRRVVGEPQATEGAAVLEAERIKAAFIEAGKMPA